MKRVLLCSVGLSPQVVTETIYVLDRHHNWQPDALVMVTTQGGEAGCRRLLLSADTGALMRYAREWRAPWAGKLANEARLEVIDTDSGDLDELRAVTDFSNRVAAIIRDICADDETMLHVSLAGGRKPAAAIMALALSLYGRAQDRLSHVLVPDAVAANPEFFYPSPTARTMASAHGEVIDLSRVSVLLFDIPFARLRRFVPGDKKDFSEAVLETGRALPRIRLTVNLRQSSVFWDGDPLNFPPVLAAWLGWLASVQASGGKGLLRVGAGRADFARIYRRFATRAQANRVLANLPDPLDPEWMEEKASRVAKLAADCAIRPRGSKLVQRIGSRAQAIYCLTLDRSEIEIISPKVENPT